MVVAPLVIDHFLFVNADGVNHLRNKMIEPWHVDLGLDVAERPSDIGGNEVEKLLGRGRETADFQVRAQHHDRDVDTGKEIGEIVVKQAQLAVARL